MTGPGAAWPDLTPAERSPGRSRQRGVRRVGKDATMAAEVVERVQRLADLEHGGNYSAALERVVEAGLATMDAAARMRAAGVELDQLVTPACTCGPDSTGESPDERPSCDQHGITPTALAWQARNSGDAEPPY